MGFGVRVCPGAPLPSIVCGFGAKRSAQSFLSPSSGTPRLAPQSPTVKRMKLGKIHEMCVKMEGIPLCARRRLPFQGRVRGCIQLRGASRRRADQGLRVTQVLLCVRQPQEEEPCEIWQLTHQSGCEQRNPSLTFGVSSLLGGI